MDPFWPRHSPHFLACRQAVRRWEGPAVVGLSGGPDSLALVAAAAAEKKDVEAVVVDHGLQEGSAAIAQQAADQARSLGVPARVVAVEVAPGNVEAQARTARYAALHEVAGTRDIWVGHTRDDQAETLLLMALRARPIGMSERAGQVVRPLLSVRRADTVGACQELGLAYWQDPMNADSAYRRVRVRQEVLPLLAEVLGGDAVEPLAHAAEQLVATEDFLTPLARPTTDCAALAGDHPAVRERKIAAWLHENGIVPSASSISEIARLCTHWRGQGPIPVGGGLAVVRAGGRLVMRGTEING